MVGGATGTLTDGNIGVEANGSDTLTIKLAEDINLGTDGSVTMGDTVINNGGLTIVDGPSITTSGIDAGDQVITNVSPGTISADSEDAVNGSQLYNTNQDVATNANNIEDNADNIEDNTTNITNNTNAINEGINFGDGSTANNFALGDTINVVGDSNVTSTTTAEGVQLGLADTISVGTTSPVTIDGNTGTIGGLTNTTWDPDNYTSGQAATEDQLKAVIDTANSGWSVQTTDADATVSNVASSKNVDFVSADENVVVSHTQDADGNTSIDFGLGNELSIGGPGKDGAPGQDGYIGVDGADGTTNVAINGKDGSIGLAGPAGAAGTEGLTTITIQEGAPGLDGVDGETRIVYTDPDGNSQEVATMEDGLNFAGNTGDTIAKKLNDTLTVKGELADTEDASGANLRVDSKDGNLNLVMAKNLTDLDSITINNGGPIISSTGIDMGGNRITNLAPGVDGTDAVNKDQLDELSGNVNQGLNFTGDDTLAVVNRKPGDTLSIVGGISNPSMLTDGNIGVVVNNNQLEVKLAEDINLGPNGSIRLGDTFVNSDGLTITDGPSVTKTGINAGNKQITGVAKGEISQTSTDAVNGSQLWEVAQTVAAAKPTVSEGDNIVVTETVNADGSIDYKVGTAKDLAVDSVTAGDTVLNDNGLTIANGPSITKDGINAGDNKITNVGSGLEGGLLEDAVGDTLTNAANIGDLKQLAGDINSNVAASKTEVKEGKNVTVTQSKGTDGQTVYEVATANEVAFDKVDVGSVTIDKGNVDKAGNTIISGVGNGAISENSTDAINGSQINAINNELNTKIDNLGDQFQQVFYDTNERIDDVERSANAGIASAMAMETAPYVPGKWTYAAGAAYHNGENAVGVTLRKTADNGRWSLSTGAATNSEGDPSFRIGISGVIN